jgi:hypothetical protein
VPSLCGADADRTLKGSSVTNFLQDIEFLRPPTSTLRDSAWAVRSANAEMAANPVEGRTYVTAPVAPHALFQLEPPLLRNRYSEDVVILTAGNADLSEPP